MNLHVGCGEVYLPGWVNIDLDSSVADVTLDVKRGLPFESESVDLIYSEHVIEHFDVADGVGLLREFYRVLRSGGIARIATPDMRYIAWRYFFKWRNQEWIHRYGYEYIQTRAEMVNICFREWGHQYIYDGEELRRRLGEAGFPEIRRVRRNRSPHAALRNLETRKDSTLVVEAVRRR